MRWPETPWDYSLRVAFGDVVVQYKGVMEICQGGPLVGELDINGYSFGAHYFGGPMLSLATFIYLPLLRQRAIDRKFVICRIDTSSNAIRVLSTENNLIHLDKILNGMLYYHIDANRSTERFLSLTDFDDADVAKQYL
jgi:hypothetical protein